MKLMSATLIAVAIAVGSTACTTPVEAPHGASIALEAPTSTACTEDSPCWDCETMGNQSCPLDYEVAATDAWDSFDHVPSGMDTDTYEMRIDYSHTVYYRATVSPNQILVPSINFPNTFHVFTYTAIRLYRA